MSDRKYQRFGIAAGETSILIYSLMEAEDARGRTTEVNDVMIRIERDRRSTADLLAIADKIMAALNGEVGE